jgi:hypothetical protein
VYHQLDIIPNHREKGELNGIVIEGNQYLQAPDWIKKSADLGQRPAADLDEEMVTAYNAHWSTISPCRPNILPHGHFSLIAAGGKKYNTGNFVHPGQRRM